MPIIPEALYPNTQFGMAPPRKDEDEEYLGYKVRKQLYPGEDAYFAQNPTVTGMAAEDGRIIFNPHSAANVNRAAVGKNEAVRLWMRETEYKPDFELTAEQKRAFKGTEYERNPEALKGSILARILSGDPSAGNVTPEQLKAAERVMQELEKRKRR